MTEPKEELVIVGGPLDGEKEESTAKFTFRDAHAQRVIYKRRKLNGVNIFSPETWNNNTIMQRLVRGHATREDGNE